MNIKISAKVTLWVNRVIMFAVLVLIAVMPRLLSWYQDARHLGPIPATAITIGFYLCVLPVGLALWAMDRLLKNILSERIFVTDNVRQLRWVRWCCALVSLICIPVAYCYLPMIFMVVIMAFLALVVTVVGQVMKAAVEIREENDLTV